ncbi:MAG TPA: TetR/AcrR family transcriptional regulator [Bosea sp. (in: a-proteobacteria)]
MSRNMTATAASETSATAAMDARRLPSEKARPNKHDAIAQAASEMFLADGFDRVTLDQIAQRAGVSKQTIYSHFADKEALFKAICTELTEKLTIPLRKSVSEGDLRSTLTRLGEDTLAMMLHPASLDLHRLVMSAAVRFPELGHVAYEAGAQRMLHDLSTLLVHRSRIGDGLAKPLDDERARILAEQFIGMLRGFHQVRGLLSIKPATAAGRSDYVRACVDLLLRGA